MFVNLRFEDLICADEFSLRLNFWEPVFEEGKETGDASLFVIQEMPGDANEALENFLDRKHLLVRLWHKGNQLICFVEILNKRVDEEFTYWSDSEIFLFRETHVNHVLRQRGALIKENDYLLFLNFVAKGNRGDVEEALDPASHRLDLKWLYILRLDACLFVHSRNYYYQWL